MSHLSPRKELIVRLHYGIGGARAHTLQEIGKILNLTRERVRQLEKLAMASLSLYIRTAHKEPCRPIPG
jgi:DNA-directed RNA polymerase sigma subunit (sigma70/sigma32)